MVYYKKRYAKRRGTTRYRKRTYRPRYTRRTPYRRRRFVYSKANKAEWKQTTAISSTTPLTIGTSVYGASFSLNPSTINEMETGPNPGQRIGRRLNANFLKIRWQADLVEGYHQASSMSIRFFAIQVKGNPDASPAVAPYTIGHLLPVLTAGSSQPSWQLGTIAPFRDGITNTCRILFDKTYKLNVGSSTSQVIFKRKIRMEPLKWEISSGTTYNDQASNPVFLYWILAFYRPTHESGETHQVPLNVIYRLVYTDS